MAVKKTSTKKSATKKKSTRKTSTKKGASKKKSATKKKSRTKRGPAKKSATKKSASKRYGKKSASKVGNALHELKHGQLKSGRSGKAVTSRKQAIAIGLSEARRAGGKVPPAPKKKSTKKP